MRKVGRRWDGVPVPYVALADLDPRAIQTFRKLAAKSGRLGEDSLAESDAVLVGKLHLTEGKYLHRAATLLNAIAHKDYAASIPIQISVYDHKVMIWNAGPLPFDWSLAQLLDKHSSQPANPDIARAFFLAGLIESWGRGIELIRNTCLDYGSPAPIFSCDGTGLWVEFPFSAVARIGKPSVKTPVETPVETPVKTPVAILKCLTANPAMTLVEVANEIGKSVCAVERASTKLVTAGKLRHSGARKNGRWEVMDILL